MHIPLPGDLPPVFVGCPPAADEGCYRSIPVKTEIFDPDIGSDYVEIRMIVSFVRVSVLIDVRDPIVEEEVSDVLLTVALDLLALHGDTDVRVPGFNVMGSALCGGEQFTQEAKDGLKDTQMITLLIIGVD